MLTNPYAPEERAARGRAVRQELPRSAHGDWRAAPDRPDPVDVLIRQGADRVTRLLPLRYARMAASPLAFLRGSAAVMAADLAARPHTGLTVQLCGDAHLLNFGLYASPERALLFDVNDFDETHPGPFEWDVERLAASVAVAARDRGLDETRTRRAVTAAVAAYRTNLRRLAELGELAVWYERMDTADLLPLIGRRDRFRVEASLARARRRTNLQALGKLTEKVDGRHWIVRDPPYVEPLGNFDQSAIRKVFADYRATLPEERRTLLDRFRVVDVARKVVGVGSVGTRCFIALLEGRDAGDPLLLQMKEAGPSVLAAHLGPGPHAHGGQRVVAGQRLLQAASDIFLGWVSGPQGRHYYWRQLRDMKGSADVGSMSAGQLRRYAAFCGTALSRAHARTGDRIAIAAYLGPGASFDRAVTEFALRYADRTAEDHAALREAMAEGRVEGNETSVTPEKKPSNE
ncbi:hypothetical protein SRB5_56180 [Streptomyces sp. RB5]|uniref:DUF2252 domain-containing protein n=1 Tax=Streptomyces smaragdinus TaxID=2585196 RepID=A0A7K0CPM1_9ACTN|nr:DUF2252 domain-containing protein [Streptomyces smaragdinus]MQY15436.1 hypothetical protein [Streptomyces smaragdinus]